MFQRPSPSWGKAANDNFILDRDRVATRQVLRLPPVSGSMRSGGAGCGLRPLLVLGFAGFMLVILCGAFLLGLAAVGLLALAICAVELVRRRVWRPVKPALGSFDRRAIGY
jgi:hypothetical protein